MGDVNKPDLEILRKADTIMLDVLRSTGYMTKHGKHLQFY